MGQLFFVIEDALTEEGGTIGGDEKASAVFFEGFIGLFGNADAHAVGRASASAFLNKEAKTLSWIGGGKRFDMEGGAIG